MGVSLQWSSDDWLLAEGALKLDLEPVIDALAVELVSAVQGFNHLPGLKCINTDRTVCLLGFLSVSWATARWGLLIPEGRIRIYYVSDFLWGEFFLFLFFHLLLKLCEVGRRVVWIKAFFETIIILRLITICEMLGLLVGLAWHCVKSVAVEVHLDVLWIHALYIAHHLWYAWEQIWKIGHSSHWLLSTTSLREAWKLLRTTSEIKLKVLLLLRAVATLWRKMSKITLRWLLLRKSLLSITY